MTNAEMENELHKKDREMQELQERLEYLYSDTEQWKRKYNNLEEEKEKLFKEMQQELLTMSHNSNERIEELDSENLGMRKYINKLERQCDETRMPFTKNIDDFSDRQKKRWIQTLGTRAQNAFWFSKQFGLDLAASHIIGRFPKLYQYLKNLIQGYHHNPLHLELSQPSYQMDQVQPEILDHEQSSMIV